MKINKFFLKSVVHSNVKTIGKVLMLISVLAIVILPASAMKQPEEYGINQCELIAKDYQKEFGGSLIWIQPLKNNGAYEFGDYAAHIINKVYLSGIGIVYWDYQSGANMTNIDEVRTWYKWYSGGKNAEIYDLEFERPSWGMKWHY